MKKKILIFAIVIITIVLILLGLRSCANNKIGKIKIETPDNIEVEEIEATSSEQISEEVANDTYKTAFIKANTDFTCLIIEDPTLEENEEAAKAALTESYQKYDLPITKNELMLALLDKYENDQEVIKAINAGLAKCRQSP